ncbi:MAG: DUF1749 domain-containing protein [Candidatus Sungbacteria bacterium]|nr:DUF1749 domain-containing protein [Candidatus Sungbacteria bacterium]
MIPVLLTKIKTSDGITLDGIYVKPKHKGKVALIWLHGLTSRFYSGQTLIKEASSLCSRYGIGYFKFNTRGHDIVARGPKELLGTAFEKFEDCVFDIRAMINFAKKLGYRKVVLAGHSTGTNKALYYMYKMRDPRVAGLALLGPTSDIAYDYLKFGKETIRRRVALAKKMKRTAPLSLVPQKFGIWTAQRYVSILEEGKPEDVFPYYNSKAGWKELKSVKIPLAVIVGSREEYLDRPLKKIVEAFRKNALRTKNFSGIIIKGADHSFLKKEKELAKVIVDWIKKI